MKSIWSTKNPSHGDGEWIKILLYKNAIPIKELGQFTQITSDNIEQVQSYITTFISNTINAYNSDEKANFLQVIKNNPIKIEVGDYYYHKSENDGFDTFTAIYNRTEKMIYTFEWHQ